MKKFVLFFLLCISINAQTTLSAGHIAFIGLYMDGLATADERFTFILLRDLEAWTVIYFTDEGWDASSNNTWYGNENDAHISWTVPAGGLDAGTIVFIKNTSATVFTATSGTVSNTLSGTWNLSSSGDQMLAYQSITGVRPASPTFIAALDADYNGYDGADGWGASYYNVNYSSYLPVGLTNGVNCLALVNSTTYNTEYDNYKYTGTLTGTATDIRNAINTRSNWTGNDDGTIDISVAGYSTPAITDPLPVELTLFTASSTNNNIHLNWQTATEVNNYGFEVERSDTPLLFPSREGKEQSDRGVWETIGFVEGHGNSNSTKQYSFVDKDITSRSYSYRLKQIDTDGSFTYSKEITVETRRGESLPTEFALFQNYPNPFNPTTKIRFSVPAVETHRDASLQHVSLKVYDVLGNEVATLVNEAREPGVYEVEFNAAQLPGGVYFYRLQTDGGINLVKKLVLLK